ncbi:Phospholipase D beta 1 [Glycine soja]|uniref:phospholipase D n=1 Tax=Glycine soja TaxID=3848 RepID=A0A0B2P952_GLYSO|nr:Phospholipase D beta 1 [Glycine soja]
MDNYGSLQHPYGYPNPPHDLYAQPPYPYPYPPNPPYTNNFNYSYPPPPPPPHSSSPYSSHIDYSSYPPPPSTSSHGSFDYPMPQPPHTYLYPSDSYDLPHSSSAYPTLDDRMNNVSLTHSPLRSKSSEEGVRVLLLVWDDPTSRNILGYKVDGVMATRDEETRRFFKHSSMQVLLCPRIAGKRNSWVKQQVCSGTIYTHHQKTVIVDADAGNNKRKIVAFVGGLDLCDGRYDTPHLPMFRTLQTLHKDDYHNPTFTGNTGGCPREPWHDLHSKIDGPAAYDILKNFEERWLRAAKPKGIQKLRSSYDDALLKLDRIRGTISASNAPSVGDDNPESWHVQIFRSIDSNSVKGFPKEPKNASSMNLVCGKNVLIDMSIHTAYVKAIRAAQHYIYIENQYFIGSSYNWSQHKDLGANNLIPMEIALKIAAKIRANERFAVYIVIPMWAFSRTNPRFMIYVRSKGMIVDDEYVILGSANINQRSIEGTRDTEIAMGAYQPHHTWARRQYYPRGQVEVDQKDKVRSLPGHEEFPDVGGKIVGSFIAIQENLTI